jgi:predicted DNA primase small subunit
MRLMNLKEYDAERTMALSFDNGHYARNLHIQCFEDFKTTIMKRKPSQIHFDSLFIKDENGDIEGTRRELVFDLDLTDFVRFCECGKQSKACSTCWLHIEGAALFIRHILVDCLGIEDKHLLWVLSGKKGIHCIVNDARFMRMSSIQLANLHTFMSRQAWNEMDICLFIKTTSLTLMQHLREFFRQQCVMKRDLMRTEKFKTFILKKIKTSQIYRSVYNALETAWAKLDATSLSQWEALENLEKNKGFVVLLTDFIIVSIYYPVIDKGPMGVNKSHLFKAPFSIHVSTKKIALPVTLETLWLRDDLPENTISLSDVNDQCNHPDFVKAVNLFNDWLSLH